MPRQARKKWHRPKLRIHRKSEEELRLLEEASTSIPLCHRAVNKDGRCYRSALCTDKKPE